MIGLPAAQVNDRRDQRVENNQRFNRKPVRRRRRTTISPPLSQRDRRRAPRVALTHDDDTARTFLAEQHRQPAPAQRMERMNDDHETQIVAGRRGLMP